MIKKTLYTLLFVLLLSNINAQEVITGLHNNAVIKANIITGTKSTKAVDTYVTLPFFDDFSSEESLPNSSLWNDKEVYINNSYAINPISIGVATLDAIDENGDIHENANSFPFESDHLTSQFIRLDSVFLPTKRAIKISDSLYLSFFYQPQGLGNAPQLGDSLVLEFLAVNENDTIFVEADPDADPPVIADTIVYEGWNHIWSSAGNTFEEFRSQTGSDFKQINIPITDSIKFFNKNFRFRFKNYASLTNNNQISWQSNVDQWNIDYVYLNINRSNIDTVYRDITFANTAPSFLAKYESMPYWQYSANFIDEMAKKINMKITNLDNTPHNATYKYNIYNSNGDLIKSYYPGVYTVSPFIESGYLNYAPFSTPPVNLFLPIGNTELHYTIEHIISGDETINNTQNDTLTREQILSNYYAYDDGSAEAGYGITPAGGQVAYRFTLNTPDTLRAVQMFFNKTWHDGNEQYFRLTVWDDNNGKPGNIIYASKPILPEFSETLNGFTTYYITDKYVAFTKKNTSFYVGWQQSTEETINIGYDFSRNSSSNTFYNTSGQWIESSYSGSLMIRPVFGAKIVNYDIATEPSKKASIKISPNPANGNTIRISLPEEETNTSVLTTAIYDITGKMIYNRDYTTQVSTINFDKGIYIVVLSNTQTGERYTNKLIITQ